MLVLVEKGVLLLNTEPGLLVLGLLHDLVAELAVVGLSGLLVVLVGLAEDNLVVSQPEGIFVQGNRVKVDIRVGALSLSSGGSIEVPDGKF